MAVHHEVLVSVRGSNITRSDLEFRLGRAAISDVQMRGYSNYVASFRTTPRVASRIAKGRRRKFDWNII